MTDRSLIGLNWLNLLVALMQTGFGAFLAVYLTTHGWTGAEVGFALSVSAMAAMGSQIPGGLLVDAAPSKRVAAGGAILLVALAALMIGIWPSHRVVLLAAVLQGAASCVLGPSIAAITLALAHKDTLGERFGHNARFAALGSVAAAGLMGAIGTWYSHRATIILAAFAGFAALAALAAIHPDDLAAAHVRTDHRAAPPKRARPEPDRGWQVASDPCLLIFGACLGLFYLGNAWVLPLAANAIARTGWHGTALVVAAAIIVPQLIAAALSPRIGRLAQVHGRRIVLLAGFVAMTLRALLLAMDAHPLLMIAFQALDGVSAAVLGVLIPLIVADITHHRGRFNLAMGIVGLFMGVGTALSTLLGGAIADHFGDGTAFVALAAAGAAGSLLVWTALPETRHRASSRPTARTA
ncbi:MAG: MFS transporter [Alphaproteobacteria bacterium]|nr:MFS transporter [Alphaproteobacteria bacterium]